jgi:hypothetical protein
MERPEPDSENPSGREPRSPVYYVQVRRGADPADWVTVDVAEDRREAARLAAAAAGGRGAVRVIGSAELLRQGGQDAINRAAIDLWTAASRRSER